MRKKFTTVYDYGMGGVWQYIFADSNEQIEEKYPKLEVLEELPDWWKKNPLHIDREYDIEDEPDKFMLGMQEPRQ